MKTSGSTGGFSFFPPDAWRSAFMFFLQK
jgi:hypothetical protein